MEKPVIGITGRLFFEHGSGASVEKTFISNEYINSVIAAGGVPFLMPVTSDKELIDTLLSRLDGILVSGGVDINPLLYGENPVNGLGEVIDEMDAADIGFIKAAHKKGLPILGICRGVQIINVAFGGTLYQDINTQGNFIGHNQKSRRYSPSHPVKLSKDSILYKLYGEKLLVNSFHHEAVKAAAPGFKISAVSDDGLIEAVENTEGSFIMAVQWHPEMMSAKHEHMLETFKVFIEECKK